MLLDDNQIVLNELIVAYREAADHLRDANEYLDSDELKSLFENIGDEHNKAADGTIRDYSENRHFA